MIRTFILYKMVDTCLDMFFDTIAVKLTPLDDIYSNGMMKHDLKWCIDKSNIKFIELYDGSLTISLMARLIIAKRKMISSYENTLESRIYEFLCALYTSGVRRFHTVTLIKMNLMRPAGSKVTQLYIANAPLRIVKYTPVPEK